MGCISFGIMAKKSLNIIYSGTQHVFEYNAGTECEAFMQTIKGFFQLGDSNIHLTNPETRNVVVLSSNLADATTVMLHAATHPEPDIEEHDNTDDESTTSEYGETSVSWPGSSEHSSHEDDFKENMKEKYKDDGKMETVTKRQRLISSSSSEIVSRVPRPPSPPPRYRRVHSDGTPIPPPPIARKAQLSPYKKWK